MDDLEWQSHWWGKGGEQDSSEVSQAKEGALE